MAIKEPKSIPPKLWERTIEDPILRGILRRDSQELRDLRKLKRAHKSALVLCGSILEATLVSNLSSERGLAFLQNATLMPNLPKAKEDFPRKLEKIKNYDKEKIQKLDLGGPGGLVDTYAVLSACQDAQEKRMYLDDGILTNIETIKNYRNLIHAGREARTQESATTAKVRLSWVLLLNVLEAFSNPVIIPPPCPDLDPTPPSDRRIFYNKLKRQASLTEVCVAKEIIANFVNLGYEVIVNGDRTTCRLRFHQSNGSFVPLMLRSNGRFRLLFHELAQKTIFFADYGNRNNLLQQLNNGVFKGRIRSDRLDGSQTFNLSMLANKEDLTGFLETCTWLTGKEKAITDQLNQKGP